MEENNLKELTGKEILNELCGKELNSKKNILEAIEKIKPLAKEGLESDKIQEIYNVIYKSIEEMNTIVKANTIMYLKNQLKGYPIEVISNVLDVINVLGENYGANRDIEKDLGGYIVIAENIVVIEMLKKDKLQGLIPEYTDIIECKEGVNWTSSLFLLSSDYAIVVVTTEELSKFLLE